MLKHSFVVHSGDSMNGDVFFMEVSGQVNGHLYAPSPPPGAQGFVSKFSTSTLVLFIWESPRPLFISSIHLHLKMRLRFNQKNSFLMKYLSRDQGTANSCGGQVLILNEPYKTSTVWEQRPSLF